MWCKNCNYPLHRDDQGTLIDDTGGDTCPATDEEHIAVGMAVYRWEIVTDKIADPDEPEGSYANAVGVQGPRNFNPNLELNKQFRMYNDDGELYYEGLYGGPDGEEMFGPLSDFGTPNAGATEIQYYIDGRWEMI